MVDVEKRILALQKGVASQTRRMTEFNDRLAHEKRMDAIRDESVKTLEGCVSGLFWLVGGLYVTAFIAYWILVVG